ncbi:MAG: hypothetical protein AABX31_01125 [Nanoarchaeota archaeon]
MRRIDYLTFLKVFKEKSTLIEEDALRLGAEVSRALSKKLLNKK